MNGLLGRYQHLKGVGNVTLTTTATLRLTDIAGKTLRNITLDTTAKQHVMDISGLPEGTYFYLLLCDGATTGSGKLTILR